MGAVPIARQSADVQRIVHILNDDSYKDETEMAVDILRSCYESWRQRDWWTMCHFVGKQLVGFYGLEPTEKALTEAAEGLGMGLAKTVKVQSLTAHQEALILFQEETVAKYGDPPCERCGHLAWAHKAFTHKGRPMSPRSGNGATCSVTCKCPGFVAPIIGEQAA